MIDVVLLRIMRKKADYQLLRNLVSPAVVSADTLTLIKDFGKYFEKHPSHDMVNLQTFLPRFKMWHPSLKEETFNKFVGILRTCMQDADDDQRSTIIQELSELELMTKLGNLSADYAAGELEDALAKVTAAYDEHRLRTGVKREGYIDIPIGELLQDEFDDSGLHWRLECLRASMRGLRPGDFGIVAGRPDKGKTSFVADSVTYFAPQLPPDRNILWLNNEGPGKRIIPRLYQAALDLSMAEMKELHQLNRLEHMYEEYMGRRNRVRVQDIHGLSNSQVELIIEANNPGLIVYDMIDNIRGFGDAARTDLALEYMYQWARERSVKYDSVGLATSQISADGDGLQFPTLSMLKDSKTGKQGACDFQLMIGASNDAGLQGSRFLSLPKNKVRRPDGPADPRAEVIFDGLKSRYRDIPVGT